MCRVRCHDDVDEREGQAEIENVSGFSDEVVERNDARGVVGMLKIRSIASFSQCLGHLQLTRDRTPRSKASKSTSLAVD